MLSNTKGFSIFEVFISVAIIGILASFVFSNLLDMRKRAFDNTAQAYLRDTVTMQSIYLIDNNNYTTNIADLTTLGLRPIPTGVELIIIDANNVGYCITAKHNKGSKKIFHATSLGIKNSLQEPTCTSAL